MFTEHLPRSADVYVEATQRRARETLGALLQEFRLWNHGSG